MKSIDFTNGLNFKNTDNFEKNVIKLLPAGVTQIYLSSVYMKWESRGSYNDVLEVEINNIRMTLKCFTHDSEAWDYYTDLQQYTRAYDNWCKATTLMVLEENKDYILELISEEEE